MSNIARHMETNLDRQHEMERHALPGWRTMRLPAAQHRHMCVAAGPCLCACVLAGARCRGWAARHFTFLCCACLQVEPVVWWLNWTVLVGCALLCCPVLLPQADETLAKFLDFCTYGHMIDNVVLIVTGTLHERDVQVGVGQAGGGGVGPWPSRSFTNLPNPLLST